MKQKQTVPDLQLISPWTSLGIVIGLLLSLSSCFVSQKEYLQEHDLRIESEAKAKEEIRRCEELQTRIDGLELQMSRDPKVQQRNQLQQENAAFSRENAQTQAKLEQCQLDRQAMTRPQPAIHVGETRIWQVANKAFQEPVQKMAEQRVPQLELCYRRHGWTEQGDKPLRGAFWLLFGLADAWPHEVQIDASSFGKSEQDNTPGDEADRAQKLQQCMLDVYANMKWDGKDTPKTTRMRNPQGAMLRVAQLVVFADNKAAAGAVTAPGFAWPWKKPTTAAQKNEVCGAGEMSKYRLAPTFDRECAFGLQCCYPCGTPGCDSVCLPSCPRELP